MPLPLLAIGAITAGIGALGGGINAFLGPKFPLNQDDIDRLLDLQMNRALSENASATRRRLASAGLGGSGVINQIVSDQAARIRNSFEEQRQRAMNELANAQYGASLQKQQARGQFFGGLAGLGGSLIGLGAGNPFAAQMQQLQRLQSQGYGQFSNQSYGITPAAIPNDYGFNPTPVGDFR